MHNIGRNLSEKARIEIEAEFKLVKAQKQKKSMGDESKPRFVPKVNHRKSETKRAITNVLDEILPTYKYSSLPGLNAQSARLILNYFKDKIGIDMLLCI